MRVNPTTSAQVWSIFFLISFLMGFTFSEAQTLPKLTEQDWQLVFFAEESAWERPLEGTVLTLKVNESGFKGSAGCNQYYAKLDLTNKPLKLDRLSTTRMFCPQPEGLMEQERRFIKALRHTKSLELQGYYLKLSYDKNKALLFYAFPLNN